MTNKELLELFTIPDSLESGAILGPGLKAEFLKSFGDTLRKHYIGKGINPDDSDWDKYIEEVWEPKLFDGHYLKPQNEIV